jgi:hypothetical protein
MKGALKTALLAGAAVCLLATALMAQTVLTPGVSGGKEIVAARKYAMQAMYSCLRDIRIKIEAGNFPDSLTNGKCLSAIAIFLPTAYAAAYPEAYPYQGSQYSFTGAPMAKVQEGAEYLRVQSEKLVNVSTRSGQEVSDQLERVKKACNDCHTVARKG